MDSTRGFALKTWNRIWAYFEGPGPGPDPCFEPKYVERVRCMGMCTDPGLGVWAHIRYRPWTPYMGLYRPGSMGSTRGFGLCTGLGPRPWIWPTPGSGVYTGYGPGPVYRPVYVYTGLCTGIQACTRGLPTYPGSRVWACTRVHTRVYRPVYGYVHTPCAGLDPGYAHTLDPGLQPWIWALSRYGSPGPAT